MKRLWKWTKRLIVTFLILLILIVISVYLMLHASLPRVKGSLALDGLSAPVKISRDNLGIPTIEGENLLDVVRAEGFVHAQDRFFQMDLIRRLYSGELSELFGAPALRADRSLRLLRLRAVATQLLEKIPEKHRQIIRAYTEGVNQGLNDLSARPPEYLALRALPRAWTSEDCMLIYYSMYEGLSFNDRFERQLGVMKAELPAELFNLLTPDTSRFDAPMLKSAVAETTSDYQPLPIPKPEVVDVRTAKPFETDRKAFEDIIDTAPGSNCWAVAGSRNPQGGAIIANDPHLSLLVPGTWYRIELRWGDRKASGLSLAGFPSIAIGSTGKLAWGVTNAVADQKDLVVVEKDANDPARYRTPEGSEPFGEIVEEIAVKGREPEKLTVTTTRWGPVKYNDWLDRPVALKSTALDPQMVNVNLLDILEANTLDEGLAVFRSWWGPSLNVLFGDSTGRIAWIVTGYIPNRMGCNGKEPTAWANAGMGWYGPIDEQLRPVIVDPPDGILFSANNRSESSDLSRHLGRVWIDPSRARRISELLHQRDRFTESDLRSIQLDTRSAQHDLYRDIFLEVTEENDADMLVNRARKLVEQWNGTADIDQPGFRLLRAYRMNLYEQIIRPLVSPCLAKDPGFTYNWPLVDEPVRRILETRPANLLPPEHADWKAFLRSCLLQTLQSIEHSSSGKGIETSWGDINRAAIAHPLALGAPALGRILNMPADPLAGHPSAIRTTIPNYGASMRMVVSPGHEERGLLHMIAGQSGHLLSAHYADSHKAWVEGLPTPFLPGDVVETLVLTPKQ